MEPKLYTRLTEALANISPSQRVWATDVQRNYIDCNGQRKVYTGKRFWLARLADWHRYMVTAMSPSAYEIIQLKSPAKLYFDIEFKVDNEELTSILASRMTTLILRIIKRHLGLSFTRNHEKVYVFHSCNRSKYSIHVVFPEFVFDNTQVSMVSYVAECKAFFQYVQENSGSNTTGQAEDNTTKWCVSHISADIIDISVYKVNQLFRIPGNSKLGQNRPLLRVQFDDGWNASLEITSPGYIYTETVNCVSALKNFLVTVIDEEAEMIAVKPSLHLPLVSPFTIQDELYGNNTQKDNMLPSGRFIKEVVCAGPTGNNKKLRIMSNHESAISKLIAKNRIGLSRKKDIILLDDDEYVYREDKSRVKGRKLHPKEIIFCNKCDVDNGRPFGLPSAKVFHSAGDELGIYCFNCETVTWLLCTAEQEGFSVTCDNQFIDTPYAKLNYNGRCDIDFDDFDTKLVVLDAPMGSGKTFVAEQYIARHKEASVLIVTFRISLARYLANRFSVNCYLEPDTFATEKESRLVVCLDSIWKIQRQQYDIIVLDEATFIRHHFVSGTIKDKIEAVVTQFQRLLESSDKIIIMQHRVTDTCIDFFCSLIGVNPDSAVVKRKFDRPVPLHPLKVTFDLSVLVSTLITTYIESFKPEDNMSISPMVVFCTRADYAAFLCWLLKDIALKKWGSNAASRIKGIWSTVQGEQWNKEFLDSPNTMAQDCDILIVTTVLQAGHSFDRWFKISFDILFLGVVSFREELQLISRLRILGREKELAPHKYAYIEKGKANNRLASYDRVYKYVTDETSNFALANLLASVVASVRSERADTYNRHYWLWRREYKSSNVPMSECEENSTSEYSSEFVRIKMKEWSRIRGIGIRGYLNDITDADTNLTEILEESQYCVIADLMTLQIESTSLGLKERVKHFDMQKAYKVLTSSIHAKYLGSPQQVCFSTCSMYLRHHALDTDAARISM